MLTLSFSRIQCTQDIVATFPSIKYIYSNIQIGYSGQSVSGQIGVAQGGHYIRSAMYSKSCFCKRCFPPLSARWRVGHDLVQMFSSVVVITMKSIDMCGMYPV